MAFEGDGVVFFFSFFCMKNRANLFSLLPFLAFFVFLPSILLLF